MATEREDRLAKRAESWRMWEIPVVTELIYRTLPADMVVEHLLMLGLVSEWPVVDRRSPNAQKVGRATYSLPTHCRHGHEYTEKNTSTTTGYRRCLTCAADQAKARVKRAQERKKWTA